MNVGRRLSLLSLAAVTALVLAPAAASAANNRFASPSPSGSEPCTDSSHPCSIDTAVNGAVSGDDITLLPGTYSTSVTLGFVLGPINGITIHGSPGTRPVVNFNTTGGADGFYVGVGSTLRDVIATSSADQTVLIDAIGATVERVDAHSGGTADTNYTCVGGNGAVFRDSVCWFSGPEAVDHTSSAFAAFSQVASDTVSLRNVTIVAPNANGLNAVSQSTQSMTVTASNVIARGGTADIKASDFGGGAAQTVTLDHSNYATRVVSATGSITEPAAAGNQTSPPVFADAVNGDFRETSASVGTIDLGTATGLLPAELDAAGMARTVGSAPDIGAFEFVPSPPAGGGTPPAPAPMPKKKKCKKKKKKSRAVAAKKCKKKRK